jgi:hypothetical protein
VSPNPSACKNRLCIARPIDPRKWFGEPI